MADSLREKVQANIKILISKLESNEEMIKSIMENQNERV
jgi:hypothetical protein